MTQEPHKPTSKPTPPTDSRARPRTRTPGRTRRHTPHHSPDQARWCWWCDPCDGDGAPGRQHLVPSVLAPGGYSIVASEVNLSQRAANLVRLLNGLLVTSDFISPFFTLTVTVCTCAATMVLVRTGGTESERRGIKVTKIVLSRQAGPSFHSPRLPPAAIRLGQRRLVPYPYPRWQEPVAPPTPLCFEASHWV